MVVSTDLLRNISLHEEEALQTYRKYILYRKETNYDGRAGLPEVLRHDQARRRQVQRVID